MKKINKIVSDFQKIIFTMYKWLSIVVGTVTIVLVAFFILIAAVIGTSTSSNEISPIKGRIIHQGENEEIAIIKLNGEIMDNLSSDGLLTNSPNVLTPDKTYKILKQLRKDDNVKSVIIYVNSPGGAVVPTQEIHDQIKKLSETKPVVVVFGSIAASGGYFLAAPADVIITSQATITGSIGVIAMVPNFSGLYDKVGVNVETIKTGKYKDMGSVNRAMSDEERKIFESVINDSYELFVNVVADGRSMTTSKVKQIADGRIYSGKQAVENGLADSVGDIDDAISEAIKLAKINDPTIKEYKLGSWIDSLFSNSLRSFGFDVKVPSIISKEQPGVYYLLN